MRRTPAGTTRRAALGAFGAGALASVAALAACRRRPSARDVARDEDHPADADLEKGTLEWAIAGEWRAADRVRDRWRHPAETLEFFGLSPQWSVIEMWPGKGYWTEILAPYLSRNKGRLTAAGFPATEPSLSAMNAAYRSRFSRRSLYGDVRFTDFGPQSGPLAPVGEADLVMFMLTLHEWMAAGLADKAFRDAFAALKPGGVLGIEQHRTPIGDVQDPAAVNGYVQEPYVRQLAAEAGFAFTASSDINANPHDTRDHPFGVWTLPPTRLSAPRGAPPDPNFNHAKYDLIGESDRMTLKFRKPV